MKAEMDCEAEGIPPMGEPVGGRDAGSAGKIDYECEVLAQLAPPPGSSTETEYAACLSLCGHRHSVICTARSLLCVGIGLLAGVMRLITHLPPLSPQRAVQHSSCTNICMSTTELSGKVSLRRTFLQAHQMGTCRYELLVERELVVSVTTIQSVLE